MFRDTDVAKIRRGSRRTLILKFSVHRFLTQRLMKWLQFESNLLECLVLCETMAEKASHTIVDNSIQNARMSTQVLVDILDGCREMYGRIGRRTSELALADYVDIRLL